MLAVGGGSSKRSVRAKPSGRLGPGRPEERSDGEPDRILARLSTGCRPGADRLHAQDGELYADPERPGEWDYPSWQFDSAGEPKPAVAEFLASARKEKIAPAELTELLDRRVGLAGGKRVRDLLLNGTQSPSAKRVIQSPSAGS